MPLLVCLLLHYIGLQYSSLIKCVVKEENGVFTDAYTDYRNLKKSVSSSSKETTGHEKVNKEAKHDAKANNEEAKNKSPAEESKENTKMDTSNLDQEAENKSETGNIEAEKTDPKMDVWDTKFDKKVSKGVTLTAEKAKKTEHVPSFLKNLSDRMFKKSQQLDKHGTMVTHLWKLVKKECHINQL